MGNVAIRTPFQQIKPQKKYLWDDGLAYLYITQHNAVGSSMGLVYPQATHLLEGSSSNTIHNDLIQSTLIKPLKEVVKVITQDVDHLW